MISIYHNPRCSKSRQTLKLLEDRQLDFETVLYQKAPPSIEEIMRLSDKLGLSPLEMIRTKDTEFSEKGFNKADKRSDAEWAAVLHENPNLLERPIVVVDDVAALGRPPEMVLDILPDGEQAADELSEVSASKSFDNQNPVAKAT